MSFQQLLRPSSIALPVESHPAIGLLPAALAVIGTAMKRVKLLVPGLPRPVTPAIHCAIWNSTETATWSAVEQLVRPLRELQITRSSNRSGDLETEIRRIERERESFFALDPVRDPAAELIFDTQLKSLREQRSSVLLVENPTAASIRRVLDQQGESGALVLYRLAKPGI